MNFYIFETFITKNFTLKSFLDLTTFAILNSINSDIIFLAVVTETY